MADERDIAIGIARIASRQQSKICSFPRAYKEIPLVVQLDAHNLTPSLTRPGEPLWHQLVRNIKSHSQAEGNFINEGYLEHLSRQGYRVTDLGLRFIREI